MNRIYETERLYVRPFTLQDAYSRVYRSWFHSEEVCRYNSHGLFPYTKRQAEEFCERLDSSSDIVWAVFAKTYKVNMNRETEVGVHIGNISLQNINWIYRSAEFAIVIGDRNYWNKGYATEASKLLLRHGFDRLNLHRIWTGTAFENEGMRALAETLGFEEEGTFCEAMFLNGEYTDIVTYGLIEQHYHWLQEQEEIKKVNAKTFEEEEKENLFHHAVDEKTKKRLKELKDGLNKVEKVCEDPIDTIEQTRSSNNKNWMDLLRLSLEHNPEETKKILKAIINKDREVIDLCQRIIEDNE